MEAAINDICHSPHNAHVYFGGTLQLFIVIEYND